MAVKAELAPVSHEAAGAATVTQPIVVSLGKVKRKRVKQLKSGRGPLMEEVADAIAEIRDELGAAGENKQLVPVVLIYKEKKRRKGGLGLPFGF